MSDLSTQITAPVFPAERETATAREAEEAASAGGYSTVLFSGGTISWWPGLGLFSASIPAGHTRRFLGCYPTSAMAETLIRKFELSGARESRNASAGGRRKGAR